MKILVIDDTELHQKAASQTLSEHELTIVGSYDDATKALEKNSYDAVLSDLLMPAGKDAQGPGGMKYVGMEMPVGFALVLLAALRGAKYVAVVTDTDHHDHPASAMLDRLSAPSWWEGKMKADFVINEAKAGFFHAPLCRLQSGRPCPACGGNFTPKPCDWFPEEKVHPAGCGKCFGTGETFCGDCGGSGLGDLGKDWGKVLSVLCKE